MTFFKVFILMLIFLVITDDRSLCLVFENPQITAQQVQTDIQQITAWEDK
jgi:hypothetical protein